MPSAATAGLEALVQQVGINEIACEGPNTYRGKSFRELQLLLHRYTFTVYPNGYFLNNMEAPTFEKAGAPPNGQIPDALSLQQSGQIQSFPPSASRTDGFVPVVMDLERVSCSSRYGGSLVFHFVQSEDIQYEYVEGSDYWDLTDVSVDLYATVTSAALNQALNQQWRYVPIQTEINVGNAVRYRKTQDFSNLPTLPGKIAEVQFSSDDLDRITGIDAPNTDRVIGYMALGMTRALNRKSFAIPSPIVDSVQIADGTISTQTRQGVKVAVVAMRIDGIDVDSDPGGGGEFVISVYEGLGAYGYQWRRLAFDMKLDKLQRSRWFTLGLFDIFDNCPSELYKLHYALVERDDLPGVGGSTIFSKPDKFTVMDHFIQIDCRDLNGLAPDTLADSGQIVDIRIDRDDGSIFSYAGALAVSYDVWVKLH